jgi:hypothetical protein
LPLLIWFFWPCGVRVQRIFADVDGFLDESDNLALFRGICVFAPFRKVASLLKCNRECQDRFKSCSANCICAESSRRMRLPINTSERAFLEQACAEFPTCPTDRHSHASPGSRGAPPRSCLRSVLCCPTVSGARRTGTGSRRPSLSATVASVAAAPAVANLRADARAGRLTSCNSAIGAYI